MVKYNQLIRDKTPDVIKDNGMLATTHVADHDEMFIMLQKKLKEKVSEFLIDESENELADILEVMQSICDNRGFSMKNIEHIRLKKREEKGGFDGKIILDSIEF